MPAIICKTEVMRNDKKVLCGLPMFALSMHDTHKSFKKDGTEVIERTTNLKCDAGHRDTHTRTMDKPEPKPLDRRVTKKPTQKGYKHVAKPSFKPTFRGTISNHQRNVARQVRREQLAKMKAEAK